MATPDIIVCGGGLVAALTACYLQRLNFRCHVFEKRNDLRKPTAADGGRSINLILTSRGLNALRQLGLPNVVKDVLAFTVPVEGRQIHNVGKEDTYQPYGIAETEVNYSVNRTKLNAYLIGLAESLGVKFFFRHTLHKADAETKTCHFLDAVSNRTVSVQCTEIILGADGVASVARASMLEALSAIGTPGIKHQIDRLGISYKEITFPAKPNTTEYALNGRRLHIWPHGAHFLMALADLDDEGTFTGTLYLPDGSKHIPGAEGVPMFDDLKTVQDVARYCHAMYPDVVPDLLPNYLNDMLFRPHGYLATVRCSHWFYKNNMLLIGDAAHGVVPFFGQGMNSTFEDCVVLARLIVQKKQGGRTPWGDVFTEYCRYLQPNAHAIAEMSIANFTEMASKVADPQFLARKHLEVELEKKIGRKYRSRYWMVMHTLIPFDWIHQVGIIQDAIFAEVFSHDLDGNERAKLEEAEALVDKKLVPFMQSMGMAIEDPLRMYYPGAATTFTQQQTSKL